MLLTLRREACFGLAGRLDLAGRLSCNELSSKPSSGLPALKLVPAQAADIQSSDYSDAIDGGGCNDNRMAMAMSDMVVMAIVCRKSRLHEESDSRTFVAAGTTVFKMLIHG